MHAYDKILACIAASIVMIFSGMLFMPSAIPVGGITGLLLIVVGLFVMPPTEVDRKI